MYTHIYHIYMYICACFSCFFHTMFSLYEIPGFKWGLHGQVHIQPQRGPCPRFGRRCRDEWCHGLAKQHAFEFESVNMELQQFKKKHRLSKCKLFFFLSLSLCKYNINKSLTNHVPLHLPRLRYVQVEPRTGAFALAAILAKDGETLGTSSINYGFSVSLLQ